MILKSIRIFSRTQSTADKIYLHLTSFDAFTTSFNRLDSMQYDSSVVDRYVELVQGLIVVDMGVVVTLGVVVV